MKQNYTFNITPHIFNFNYEKNSEKNDIVQTFKIFNKFA